MKWISLLLEYTLSRLGDRFVTSLPFTTFHTARGDGLTRIAGLVWLVKVGRACEGAGTAYENNDTEAGTLHSTTLVLACWWAYFLYA